MHAYLLLAIAIIGEVVGTSALKSTDGFTRLVPSALVFVGYGTAFYCLTLVVNTIPVGMTYAIWSGVGIVAVTLVAWAMHGQRPDAAAVAGMALIIAGVLVLNLWSKTSAH